MNAVTKLAAFAAGLALLFGGAAVAGGAIGPAPGKGVVARDDAEGHSDDMTSSQAHAPDPVRIENADGSWRTTVRLDDAGSYRLFADFSHEGENQTLAIDLRVDGAADLQPLPEPETTAVSDGGYDVRLVADAARPGEETDLRFAITREGEPVRAEPYLGAGGHLVALREGDLAFLRVHPTDDAAARFAATFPTAGRYRLFLQFKTPYPPTRIHTVAFTQEVS